MRFHLTKETQNFLASTLCKQISVVFLYFHFVAKIVKSRQKKYISCPSAIPINIVLKSLLLCPVAVLALFLGEGACDSSKLCVQINFNSQAN